MPATKASPAPSPAPRSAERSPETDSPASAEAAPQLATDAEGIDDLFSALKSLLSAVEKLQKARQDVGDIKPLLVRMLDGELLSGEDLERLKSGVNGLSKLVRCYDDYQSALDKAQPARDLLDQVLKS
ncbi:MAG TPA: hypothetical protein V6D06_13920 [Trichocoleus sp.]